MTDEQTEQPEVEQAEPGQDGEEQHSRIVIEFAQPGSAEPQSIQCYAVSPGQLHAAARRLQLMADRHVQQIWAQAEMEQAQKRAQMAQMQAMLAGKKVA